MAEQDQKLTTPETVAAQEPKESSEAAVTREDKAIPEVTAATHDAQTAVQDDAQQEAKQKARKKKRRRYFDILRYVAIALCLAVIAYEAFKIISHEMENRAAISEYQEINDTYVQIPEDAAAEAVDTDGEEEVDNEKYPKLDIDFEGLASLNPDFIGWLYFPAVDLSYPVVQEQKIDEYLGKTFQGVNNGNGAVFMDIISNPKFTGLNNILFAHNMINKSMFGILPTLADDDNYKKLEKMPYFYIYTKDAVFRYYVYGFYGSPKDGVAYADIGSDKKKYDELARYIRENNMYKPKRSVNFGEYPELLQLSTCYYTDNPRFIVGGYKDHTWYTNPDGPKAAEDYYQELRDECVTISEKKESSDIEISVDLNQLNEINPDNGGWFYFPALDISYPIAVEKKSNEYLSRTFSRENDGFGTLFFDIESDPTLAGYSNMIFGHAHADGTMFGSFDALIEEKGKKLNEDPSFYIINEEGTYKYKAVACYRSDSSDMIYTIVKSGDAMQLVVEHIIEANAMDNGRELTEMDFSQPTQMLTLTTCSDFGDKTRLLLSGVLVQRPDETDASATDDTGSDDATTKTTTENGDN